MSPAHRHGRLGLELPDRLGRGRGWMLASGLARGAVVYALGIFISPLLAALTRLQYTRAYNANAWNRACKQADQSRACQQADCNHACLCIKRPPVLPVPLLTCGALVRLFTRAVLNGGWPGTSRRLAERLTPPCGAPRAGLRSASICMAEHLAPGCGAPRSVWPSTSRPVAERLDPYGRAARADLRSTSRRLAEHLAPGCGAPRSVWPSSSRRLAERLDPYGRAASARLRSASICMVDRLAPPCTAPRTYLLHISGLLRILLSGGTGRQR
jgi:hypothetical protein